MDDMSSGFHNTIATISIVMPFVSNNNERVLARATASPCSSLKKINLALKVSFIGPQSAISSKRKTLIASSQISLSMLTPKYLAERYRLNNDMLSLNPLSKSVIPVLFFNFSILSLLNFKHLIFTKCD